MSMQTAASFKKEALSFFRTGRAFIIALVIIGLSALSPLLYTGLSTLMDSMSDIYDSMGVDLGGMTQVLSSSASLGVASTVSDITGAGLIVFLLLINRAAGGEQKERDIIIPMSTGLCSFSYLFPKYIIYPLFALVLSIMAMITSWGVSSYVFEFNDVTLNQVLMAGMLTGLSMMFYVCYHITLGTATGKPGMSAAVCIAMSLILPNIFAVTDADYMFNPFALSLMAGSVISTPELTGAEIRDMLVTAVFVLALLIASFYIALFAQNAKKIDNTGNEMIL